MFGKMLFTRPARDLATTSTSQSQPGPSGRSLFKRPLTFLQNVQGLKYFYRRSHSQDEVKDARLQENGPPEPSFQAMSHSSEGFDGVTQGHPQPQVPHSASPAVTPSPANRNTFSPAQAEEEVSATSTPPTTFSAATSLGPATARSVPTTPTSTLPSSLHSFEPHADLLAVNQRIAELEALAKQVEQEHADYVKVAREMDVTLTSLEKEVDSAIEAIKNVNRRTTLEDEQCMELHHMWCDEVRTTSKAEGDLFWAKHEYEVGQKHCLSEDSSVIVYVICGYVGRGIIDYDILLLNKGVPVFKGGSETDCEEFIRFVYTYAFDKGKAKDNNWIAAFAATRFSGPVLRWFARLSPDARTDWLALQVALLDEYHSDYIDKSTNEVSSSSAEATIPTPAAAAPAPLFQMQCQNMMRII
ncbi:hypothetical protein M407DRAFT_33362 [Tulasnella calospora MUT 4182]|uniref:Retrotransposon gag domain-containing protein n=1 Tax=Tulasnella calospora MUT 4182 TaxID=1051891 RepID=A0A0C3L631_9AGAM|nr:hypothetical protein M407DRAFT_33362 [Tulasnella calospora MUT 4182]